MASTGQPASQPEFAVLLDPGEWRRGPPHHLFREMRQGRPEAGFWSLTRPEDIRRVSRDWQTYSSQLGGVTSIGESVVLAELMRSIFIATDPAKHDRIKVWFERGFAPKRTAEHEEAIRRIACRALTRAPAEDDAVWARRANATLDLADGDLDPDRPQQTLAAASGLALG